MDRCGLAGIIAQHADGAQTIGAGTAERRAHVERVELRQFVEILLDEVGKLQQQVLPLERLDLAPGPFEGAASGSDRTVDIFLVALGNGCEQFAGRGVMGLEALAGGSIDPLPVDQHLLVGPVGERVARDWNSLRHSHG
ncbi:hypothetical protein ACVWWO_005945 [Bradyrhizobium sp. F1.13.1]